MNQHELIALLDRHPEYRRDLFIRGFLLTDGPVRSAGFPLYDSWNCVRCGKYSLLTHPLTGLHIHTDSAGRHFLLFGHAYNPFTMEHREEPILSRIAEAYGTGEFQDRIDELTGVFVFVVIDNDALEFQVDPSGMQSACCGMVNGYLCLSSHPQLIGDLWGLQMDPFVRELVDYKWYGRVMGPYLPADLTPFAQLRRIVPSSAYRFDGAISHRRFWPLKELKPIESEEEYRHVITQAADILKANMALIPKKWDRPWISMTGGIDSNTTFAAANGQYDRYETFSYISAPKEVPDAEAAATIAERFGVKHHTFHIPQDNAEVDDYEVQLALLCHNNGYVATPNANEARKRMYLRRNANCDVEIKSWVSETIRAYWYKHYGRTNMPKLSAKLFRNLYKIFLGNRALAHRVDRLFETYIRDFEYHAIPNCYPPADMHYNEVTWGSWGGLHISEMRYCFDITFAYNNRKFLELLFRVPLADRIRDQHHLDMKQYLNRALYDMNIRVVNMKETDFRAFMLNVIFTINQLLPF